MHAVLAASGVRERPESTAQCGHDEVDVGRFQRLDEPLAKPGAMQFLRHALADDGATNLVAPGEK